MRWYRIATLTWLGWLLTIAPAQARVWLELILSQRRVQVWQDNRIIRSYPVAVGKPGWETPQGDFVVQVKVKDPVWQSFTSNQQIPAGHPNNPLGRHWIGFWHDGVDEIGFHGTPHPETIGKAVSHGCVRMYPRDVAELFDLVELGTPVRVRR
ncbi:MAG: L,D-transpeptidase [Gloeomargarita sp. DG02_4_bins_56]